jgi:hypothetical protein
MVLALPSILLLIFQSVDFVMGKAQKCPLGVHSRSNTHNVKQTLQSMRMVLTAQVSDELRCRLAIFMDRLQCYSHSIVGMIPQNPLA